MKQGTFFEKYPHEYEFLTNEQARLPKHDIEVQTMIKRFAPGSVLDAGCGAGLTSYLFASHGVKTTGVDCVKGMLGIAHAKYDGKSLPLEFRHGRFESLPKSLNEKFDLVVCLANSLSGLPTRVDLRNALKRFHDLLRPKGSLVLQLLNVESVTDQTHEIVRTTEHENIVYLRYLSRRKTNMMLTVIRIDTGTGPATFEPFVHEYEPFSREVLTSELKRVKFNQLSAYSDLTFKAAFRRSSRDLVMVATRG